MAKGTTLQLNYERYIDEDTGAKVTRFTPTDVICHRNYFYQKCFIDGGKKLIFAGEFDTHRNYYLLDLATGIATDNRGGVRSGTAGQGAEFGTDGCLAAAHRYLDQQRARSTGIHRGGGYCAGVDRPRSALTR